jgi:hypothetical protein
MKTKRMIVLLVCALQLTGMLVPSVMAADELPGIKKFNDLVRDMNQEINAANKDAREKEAQMAQLQKADELIPQVKEAKEQLQKAVEAYEKSPTPQTSEALQRELAAFAKKNADYVVLKSKELKLGIDLLDSLSDRFSTVIALFMEMEDVSRDLDITAKQGEEYLEMERSVVGLSEMIDKMESFTDPEDLSNLRTTLEMQAKMRLQEDQVTADLTEHLKAQAKTYTFLQAQTSMARDSLIRQKSLLSRVGLMKISENLLLKTSYMLIGNVNVTDFPEHFMAESKKSMEGMLEFSETTTLGKNSKRSSTAKPQSSYLAKAKESYLNRNK